MGASRKLQGEIDRVLKKVQEGVDVFDSIWNKVYDTDNMNQKEKFEADLKKEIKKLQRYRDQIKTWIQSSEIKDKKVSASYEQALMDARKQIEREMERFKICEKETKTKAFSKEGLGQQPKTDPKEKAKSETRDWLNNMVSELENQIDSFEAEIEGLSVKKGKTRPPRLTHLETSITRHKAHIMKLELILRLLDNDELSPEQVNDVKDFIDDYVERNQEDFDEFSDVDELYNTLPLDKVESLEDLVTIVPPTLVKVAPANDQVDDSSFQDNTNSDSVPRTPPPKSSDPISSVPHTPSASHAVPGVFNASSPAIAPSTTKEEDLISRKSVLPEPGLKANIRSSLPSPTSTPFSPTSTGVPSLASEMGKRNMLSFDERSGSNGVPPSLVSPLSNRVILPQVPKTSDGLGSPDTGTLTESMSSRVLTSPVGGGMHWRPGVPFQNQTEVAQFRGRTEIAPDQREKYLQRHQLLQHGQANLLSMPPLTGVKQQYAGQQQQSPLLQQFNAQSSSGSMGIAVQAPPGLNNITSSQQQQQTSAIQQQPSNQQHISIASREAETGVAKVEELHQPQSLAEDPSGESGSTPAPWKNLAPEEESKASYVLDTPAGVTAGSLPEPSNKVTRDIGLSPGEPLQSNPSSSNLGVIGRRSVSDLGAIGDNISASTGNSEGTHDQSYNLNMLEAAYYKLPQPKDSERAKTYTPRNPVSTPTSYPQAQAPMVNNPAFWERLGADTFGTDTLFFSFYYQQNTYQQYLAAKELKKQSWRYHRKYNTWFQRHEEPKVATDDYEQGTYVYFDFHIANDEQHGWCQRIKTEFTFEYSHLEDELTV